MKLLPKDESNPIYDIILSFKLLLTKRGSNSLESIAYSRKILSKIRSIFSNDTTAEVFVYLCLHGAATAWIIQCQLEKPESTTYRALRHLRTLEVLVPALRTSKIRNSRGGPRPVVWALEGATSEEVAGALRLHFQLLSPKYRIAEEVAQSILADYVTPRQVKEITYREIVIQVKELKIPFSAPDIADLAATYLHEKGIKVWR
ncbi:hypothetical protein HQ586_00740 [Candidatus Bathyarchaeota archaeon]|nr:hypothetical protein [Candidatus Bathyarchaeota archaeon]